MQNFDDWIGKKEIQTDFSNARQVDMMQAILNQENKSPAELPHLYHWCYFLPITNQSELAEDGHPKKGGFLPPIPFPKRMWAGGRLQFLAPITINTHIRRESEIIKIEFKQGKSGNMYFVTVKHQIFAGDTLAIIEEHDIVYREASNQIHIKAQSTEKIQTQNYSYKKQFPVDSVTLFRYSAVTFNGHRIHYDREFCTEVEGYPGLVVHGPLMATLLLHFFKQENPEKSILGFDFRAIRPVFDFNDFYICGDIQENQGKLWIEHADGQPAMQATITFKGE
nr:hypothetical protein [Acinetobacter sp. Marseille-Q1620]